MNRKCIPLVVALSALCGCIADDVIRIKGRVVDQSGHPYDSCTIVVFYDGRDVHHSSFGEQFEQTIVFHPSSASPLSLRASCTGSRSEFSSRIRHPDSFAETVDLGTIVLERDTVASSPDA